MIQAWAFMALILCGSALIIFFSIAKKINQKRNKCEVQSLLQKQASWKNATKVSDLISMYLDVILQHGPDSEIAKAFRFGVNNGELWKEREDDSLDSFRMMIDICDKCVRRNRK